MIVGLSTPLCQINIISLHRSYNYEPLENLQCHLFVIFLVVPVLHSLSPNLGPVAGGTRVIFGGQRLNETISKVYFGNASSGISEVYFGNASSGIIINT